MIGCQKVNIVENVSHRQELVYKILSHTGYRKSDPFCSEEYPLLSPTTRGKWAVDRWYRYKNVLSLQLANKLVCLNISVTKSDYSSIASCFSGVIVGLFSNNFVKMGRF